MALQNEIDLGTLGIFMESANSRIGTLGGATDFINGTIERFKFTGAYQVNVAVFFLRVVGKTFHDAPPLTLLDGNANGFFLIILRVRHSWYQAR